MPPKRKATTTVGSPRAHPRKAGAAEPHPAKEETTEVAVYIFDARWKQKLHELYTDRNLTDVVLAVGDNSVAAHRVILTTVSPHLQALFDSEMVVWWRASRGWWSCSAAQLSWEGVKAIVDFAYTGTVALSGSTVVSVIEAANMLQVEVVDRWSRWRWTSWLSGCRLDVGNVLSAMALGTHYSAGAICRGLHERSEAGRGLACTLGRWWVSPRSWSLWARRWWGFWSRTI
jgi:hypothetical protein